MYVDLYGNRQNTASQAVIRCHSSRPRTKLDYNCSYNSAARLEWPWIGSISALCVQKPLGTHTTNLRHSRDTLLAHRRRRCTRSHHHRRFTPCHRYSTPNYYYCSFCASTIHVRTIIIIVINHTIRRRVKRGAILSSCVYKTSEHNWPLTGTQRRREP